MESHAHSEGTGFIALLEASQGDCRAAATSSTQTRSSLYFLTSIHEISFYILSLLVGPYGLSHTS